jgi:ATP-dependent DNA helicase RecG
MRKHTLETLENTLTRSLVPVPNELNELDWKLELSPKTERLKEHLSAFANYPGGGFLVFGINSFGDPVGLQKSEADKILEKLGSIAREGLQPPVQIEHAVFDYEGQNVLGVFVSESSQRPVKKRGQSLENSYIRSGGQTRKMSEHELRMALISSRSLRFEEIQGVFPRNGGDLIKDHLDFSSLFARLKYTPASKSGELEFLLSQKLITKSGGSVVPTNLAILCCAKDLSAVPGYERYCIRVIHYKGTTKLFAQKDRFFTKGYTHCLDEVVEYILSLMPHSEIIKNATRVETPVIPEIAIREIVANSVIHRDYTKTEGYTTIELYDDRIEVTNPGGLLPEILLDRLIGHHSSTRNEVLADIMRKLSFCEERGSGMIKVVSAMEYYGLPAAEFESGSDYFKAVLYRPKDFADMEKTERINAVFQHACLNKLVNKKTTNSTVRERFRFDPSQTVKATRVLNDAFDAGRIKIANPNASPRDIHYYPYWA